MLKPFEIERGWNGGPMKYGASMGRPSDGTLQGKVHLQLVRLDYGGYDSGGAYWGWGDPLFCAWDNEGNQVFFRAKSRADAKAHPTLEGCRFFR